jgi:prolyl-tRNA synthetase
MRHVDIARDIAVTQWGDLRTVKAGELCLTTGKPLKIQRAIEVGHVFKLGTKYSEKLNARFLDAEGKSQPCVMGCYGIGVTRTLQAIIEQCNDKDGIIWPVAVAPYVVCLTPLSIVPGSAVMETAEKLYKELTEAGVEVIIDDRDERPGVKFKDADLVGFPIRVGIGEKSLAKGEVELKPRGGTLQLVKTEDAVSQILAAIAAKSA